MRAQAVVLSDFGSPSQLRVTEVMVDPRPNEALLRVLACGVNYFDIDVRRGKSRRPVALPLVLGREVAAVVQQPAADGSGPPVGTHVAVRYTVPCGNCQLCVVGKDHFCESIELIGVTRSGGYATHLAAPTHALIPIRRTADPVMIAAGQIGYSTAIHALFGRARLQPGERVMVTGAAGAVGSAAVQVALQHDAIVVAAVGHNAKVSEASKSGAHEVALVQRGKLHVVSPPMKRIEDVQVIVDTAGGEYFQASLKHLGVGGRIVVVGAHAGEIAPIDFVRLYQSEHSLIGTARATRDEISQAIQGLEVARFTPNVTHVVKLTDVQHVHELIESRSLIGKAVIVPSPIGAPSS